MKRVDWYTTKLLWRERGRVWRWYWFFRRTQPAYVAGTYLRGALEAVINNPGNADDWLMNKPPEGYDGNRD